MRTAIIRRHNSMYATSSGGLAGAGQYKSPYTLQEVAAGGGSSVRPIVTLQRSKTSVAASSGPHYRAANLHSVARCAIYSR